MLKRTAEVRIVTVAEMTQWASPPFQRPVVEGRANLREVARIIRDTGEVPGVVTLGELDGVLYLIDGQHRRRATEMSERTEVMVYLVILKCLTMEEMSRRFLALNSSIVPIKVDDRLRSAEITNPNLRMIRDLCGFVGYRKSAHHVVTMSVVLRSFLASCRDTPGPLTGVLSSDRITLAEAEELAAALAVLYKSWGNTAGQESLWGGLNLSVCLWLYRRVVFEAATTRNTTVTPDEFSVAMVGLTDRVYLEWLRGKSTGPMFFPGTYDRIKSCLVAWLRSEGRTRIRLPSPSFARKERQVAEADLVLT